jgi:4-diphosphocytidyl-2-C-methyl-D-erythritol kinase
VRRAPAPAKINLGLVVGPVRADGRHEVTTILQRIDLCDRIELRPSPALAVEGFEDDTLVAGALRALAADAEVDPRWKASIEKRIPVAAGLGGGSSDAATALRLAGQTLERSPDRRGLHLLAAGLGADVPFFLEPGPQLAEDDGTRLSPLDLPQDYWVVVVLPTDRGKASTAEVYREFDARGGERGHDERRARLLEVLDRVRRPRDLTALPPNDLASSPVSAQLLDLGAFRADVTGAGPAVYGLFLHEHDARAAARRTRNRGRAWVTVPCWYG